jgi:hypothetical protein
MTAAARVRAIAALIGLAAGSTACLPPPPWAFGRHDRVERHDHWDRDGAHRDRWERRDDRRHERRWHSR